MGGIEWFGYDIDWIFYSNMFYIWSICSFFDSLFFVIYIIIYNGIVFKVLKRDCLIYLILNVIIVWNYFVKY